ncbi:MAG: urea transporter [Candidatus Brocadia sp.]|nr:urea transporter [Candidatus Brocadia sp.]
MTQTFLFAQDFTAIFLRGSSQVFLLNNVITGALFLAGVFYASS